MKTSLTFLLVILILVNSCTSQLDKNSNKFTLQGEIKGQDTGKIAIQYVFNDVFIRDTARIKNGKFVLAGKIFEPTRAELNAGNELNRVFVYLEPGKMKISLFKDKFIEFKMTGSKIQTESDLLNKMGKPVKERLSILKEKLSDINDSINNSKAGPSKLLQEKKAEQIDKQLSQTQGELDSVQLKFILENPKSFLAPVYLRSLEEKEVISLDSVKSIFNGLDNSIQKSRYGKFVFEDIRKKENILIGNQAPDFKAIDLNQKTVTLSQFKGTSVVLLDFWASWCVPCRESIPYLKTIYKKYHSNGLEVIAISIDENRKAWIEAVNQDSTGMWYHIPVAEKGLNGPITNDDIFKNYYYKGVPEQLLIDKNGKIIGRLIGRSKENEESLDRLLAQIFD